MVCNVRPTIFPLIYKTLCSNTTSRDNYVIMSKQPPSWIPHIGFLDVSKTSENTKNNLKFLISHLGGNNTLKGSEGNKKNNLLH